MTTPCLKSLDADCFDANPKWAKQAFAYRLIHLLTPKALTKRLPKGIRGALLAPGVTLPPGVVPPPGTVVSGGIIMPAGWSPGDPWPSGWIAGAVLPSGVEGSGVSPPIYTGVWSPGPVATAPPGGVVAVTPWFYEPFNTLDTAIWTHYTYKGGVSTVVSGRLEQVAATAGGYTAVYAPEDATIPQALELEFEMNHASGTGQVFMFVYMGAKTLYFRFTPPTTLNFLTGSGWSPITIDSIIGTSDTWIFNYNGTTCEIYRNGVSIQSGLTLWANATVKGRRIIHTEAPAVVYFDEYSITAL